MIKKLPVLFLILLFAKISLGQKLNSDKLINKLYRSEPANTQLKDTVNYYLVKFNSPQAIDTHNLKVVKRISYNYYVIASREIPQQDHNIASIERANSFWKASDNLVLLWQKHPNKDVYVDIVLKDHSSFDNIKKYGSTSATSTNTIILHTSLKHLPELAEQPNVAFITQHRLAHEELAIDDIDLGINEISPIHKLFPAINGNGINVSVKEDRYDNDLDLLGRSFDSFPVSDITSGHATTMATLIGGNGNSFIKGLGAAPSVKFTSSDFVRLLPDSTAVFQAYHITVQNHSYGTGIENYYGAESVAYDQQVSGVDSLLHVFSAGNIGTTTPSTGLYSGIAGYANLSGDFKQAKNVLVVGGTGRTNVPEDLSSSGPTYDGRVKPELVADGEDGTSGAAALVSGTAALLQQAFKTQFGRSPSAALLKCILINSANEMGQPGPHFKTGYGKLNALEALRTVNENRFKSGSIAGNEEREYTITVPANCRELKVSLAWNDPEADVNAPAALINDLDLFVTTPSGQNILPWVLSSHPSVDSLSGPAKRQRDTLNNAELVTLQNPGAGSYVLHVRGSKIMSGAQSFHLAYQTKIANQFEWVYPAAGDQLFAADENYVRWQTTFNASNGILSVSYDHGSTWQKLNDVNLQNNYFDWTAPDSFTTAMLKMDIGGQSFASGEFSISKPLNLQVGYICTSGTLLHWPAQPGSTGYSVYTITNNLLQKISTVTDTTIIIPSAQQTSTYYAVSANGNGFDGLRSYTIDATTQGVGCYIETLLATVADNKVLLNLQIGSTVNLKSITWEKMIAANQYTALGTTQVTTNVLSYNFTDANPKDVQYYRVKLITTDGSMIYSDSVRVVLLQSKQFAVYPNPVGTQLTILSGDINNYELKMYDTSGRLRMEKTINELENIVPVDLNPGVYIYVIVLNGKVVQRGKLIKT